VQRIERRPLAAAVAVARLIRLAAAKSDETSGCGDEHSDGTNEELKTEQDATLEHVL
jgi:hypothetical protein